MCESPDVHPDAELLCQITLAQAAGKLPAGYYSKAELDEALRAAGVSGE